MLRFIAPAVPEKVRRIGRILGAEFTGREDPQQIGQITADAYCRFRDSLGLPPVSEYDIDETKIDALVPKIVSEIFAGLTPVTVDEAAARTLLKETLQR